MQRLGFAQLQCKSEIKSNCKCSKITRKALGEKGYNELYNVHIKKITKLENCNENPLFYFMGMLQGNSQPWTSIKKQPMRIEIPVFCQFNQLFQLAVNSLFYSMHIMAFDRNITL